LAYATLIYSIYYYYYYYYTCVEKLYVIWSEMGHALWETAIVMPRVDTDRRLCRRLHESTADQVDLLRSNWVAVAVV